MVNSVSINTGMKIPLCHVDCISCGSYPVGGAGLYHNRPLSMVCEEISTDFWHGYGIWILTNNKDSFFLHSYRHLLYLLFLVCINSSPPTRYDSLSLWLWYIFQIISSMSHFFSDSCLPLLFMLEDLLSIFKSCFLIINLQEFFIILV